MKYVLVTEGVVSGLGKGVTASSIGLLVQACGLRVTSIKIVLSLLGVVGSIAAKIWLAQPVDESLVQYVVDHPTGVWFIVSLFAALTGLVFKEGLCYGKLEAGILTFIILSLLLGHLIGLMAVGVKLSAWRMDYTICDVCSKKVYSAYQGAFCFQDGAIVANNPTIIAI